MFVCFGKLIFTSKLNLFEAKCFIIMIPFNYCITKTLTVIVIDAEESKIN